MKFLLFSGFVLTLAWSMAFADSDLFEGKFITEENGEFAVLTLVLDGSGYSGSILLDGHASPITAKKRGMQLRGELQERDGERYPFEARIAAGTHLIMEFDDGAMIVFRRQSDDVQR